MSHLDPLVAASTATNYSTHRVEAEYTLPLPSQVETLKELPAHSFSEEDSDVQFQRLFDHIVKDSSAAKIIFSQIRIQPDSNAPIHQVVRDCLHLPSDTPLTDHHARLAALSALSAHMRQSRHTCFSVVICLYQLHHNLVGVLTDFQELLFTSKLSRQVGNAIREFPFLLGHKNNHPLLDAWSAAIAGMAEAKVSGMLKNRLFMSVKTALDVTYVGKELKGEETVLKASLEKECLALLLQRAHYLYDPSDNFILYERDKNVPAYRWKCIDSAEAFQDFISSLIIQAGDTTDSTLIKRMATHLSVYSKGEVFLRRVLKEYKPLRQFPWQTRSGNDTEKTLEVYFENKKVFQSREIQANNAHDLLDQLLHFGRENPRHLLPMRITGLHAFCLTLHDRSLRHAWRRRRHPQEWVRTHVIEPGQEVAHALLSVTAQQKILSALKQTESPTQAISVVTFKQKLQANNLSLDSHTLDALILSHLPLPLRRKLARQALHVADSNWIHRDQDVHFCFFYNPCSEAIALGQICADGSHLKLLDQQRWVQHPWEIFF